MTVRTRLQQARPGGSRGLEANDAAGAKVRRTSRQRQRVRALGVPCRFVLSTLLGALLFVAPRMAFADDQQQFEMGKTRFDGGEYDKAAERFAAMLDPSQSPCAAPPGSGTSACRLTDPDLIERARTVYAASLIALEHYEAADEQIEVILHNSPSFSPDPAAFPQKVVDRFTTVRAKLRQQFEAEVEQRAQEERERRLAEARAKEADQRWLDAVLQAASEERVVEKNSRFIAALPFGIGQFQNGNRRLGWTFAISEAVLAATTIITSQTYTYYASFDPTLATQAEREFLSTNQLVSLRINQVAFGAFAALAVVGIVQAQAAFVPERVTLRKRWLPSRPTTSLQIVPTLGLSPNMVGIGMSGTF